MVGGRWGGTGRAGRGRGRIAVRRSVHTRSGPTVGSALLRRVALLLVLVVPFTLLTATSASASTESEFVSRANGERTSRGLRAYPVRSDLSSVARRQAERMASAGRIYHNPNLGSEVSGWRNVGENVGRGPSVSSIHGAFMGSSSHRANILSTTYTEFGVGTARGSNGDIYVSQVFRRPAGATSYTPPPKPVVRRPAARPVYRAPAPRRASRSAVRRPVAAPRPPARKKVVVDPTPARLRKAWAAYRTTRPAGSLSLAVAFVRTNRLIAG